MRTNLVFIKEAPKVYPDWIYFMKEPAECNDRLIPGGTYLYMYEAVQLIGLQDIGDFVSVCVKPTDRPEKDQWGPVDSASKEIHLRKGWSGGFGKTFNKVFSAEPVAELPYVHPETVADLLKYCGYPIYQCRRNGQLFYHYNEWYVPRYLIGGHTAWFEIKDGKIVGWSGEI